MYADANDPPATSSLLALAGPWNIFTFVSGTGLGMPCVSVHNGV